MHQGMMRLLFDIWGEMNRLFLSLFPHYLEEIIIRFSRRLIMKEYT